MALWRCVFSSSFTQAGWVCTTGLFTDNLQNALPRGVQFPFLQLWSHDQELKSSQAESWYSTQLSLRWILWATPTIISSGLKSEGSLNILLFSGQCYFREADKSNKLYIIQSLSFPKMRKSALMQRVINFLFFERRLYWQTVAWVSAIVLLRKEHTNPSVLPIP